MCSQSGHDLMQTLMFTVQHILLGFRKRPNGQRLNLLRHITLPPHKLKQKICRLRTQLFVSTLFQLLKQRREIGLALVYMSCNSIGQERNFLCSPTFLLKLQDQL